MRFKIRNALKHQQSFFIDFDLKSLLPTGIQKSKFAFELDPSKLPDDIAEAILKTMDKVKLDDLNLALVGRQLASDSRLMSMTLTKDRQWLIKRGLRDGAGKALPGVTVIDAADSSTLVGAAKEMGLTRTIYRDIENGVSELVVKKGDEIVSVERIVIRDLKDPKKGVAFFQDESPKYKDQVEKMGLPVHGGKCSGCHHSYDAQGDSVSIFSTMYPGNGDGLQDTNYFKDTYIEQLRKQGLYLPYEGRKK